ncbi:hypothetical protein EHF33_20870 (plasmid) [Deinococcus psychrotolerans]|uniref:site-specific DNA-methyltransferase (adenine-specific) n=1 Tax=Deinococcus psychrotolerans TaxID=2489213 RepID=A0A3G8YW22_9DEIO|nr:N-6 DNA methylase [Deinococcus psychrotolerans]AZI45366.1 hypothetical protein EHF33_20870 [Deinococcus psychrotolerans]
MKVDHITPHSLARLNAALLDIRPGMRLLDFAVGYAGTWVAVAKRLHDQGENPNSVYFVGQDVSPKVLLVATCHLMLHGITSFQLQTGDALTDPQTDASRFDRVVADPTFGLHITARNDNWRYDPRFLAARTPPRSAEWLFMMHGLSVLAPGGRAVFITIHGPLFRSGSEREIRKFYANWLTAVVALPRALYPGTSLAVALTVFDRPADHSSAENDVLMINASQLRAKDGRHNILSSEVIDRLAKLVVSGSDEELPAIHEFVDQARLADNDHSWQPSRYVYEPAPYVRSLEDIRSDLAAAQKTAQQAASAMKAALDALE